VLLYPGLLFSLPREFSFLDGLERFYEHEAAAI
jgi:hypothetical protein